MPKRLRVLSGDEVITILEQFEFVLSFAKGSHCKMARVNDGEKQVIVVPRHSTIAKGTLNDL
jgi:predicted RNA binding protein YcfA (HicA-like mRNA interferase family)